jgi:hypothetical protein
MAHVVVGHRRGNLHFYSNTAAIAAFHDQVYFVFAAVRPKVGQPRF